MSEGREKLLEEKKHVSGQISDLTRQVSFGLIAGMLALLISDDNATSAAVAQYPAFIWIILGLGSLSILSDYFQFLTGYVATNRALRHEEGRNLYNEQWWSYRLRPVFYWIKQIACFLGVLLFFIFCVKAALG